MTRNVLSLLVAGLLCVPLPATSQTSPPLSSRARVEADTEEGAAQAEIFMSAFREVLDRHMDVFSDSTLWAYALEGLIEGLGDPYAEVFTPSAGEEFDETNTGNYSGIGVQITQLNNAVTITAVFRDTPADMIGLLVGDVIVGVNGHDATEWSTAMASDSIRGEVGTSVDVRIRRQGFERPIPFEIERAEVHVPAVTADIIDGTNIGYVAVGRMARGSAVEVDSVLRVHSGAEGLILDLRRNPGGFLDEALMMSDVFLPRGAKLASIQTRAPGQDRGTNEESWSARIPARVSDAPIVILVDEYTASAAEIVSGALQDHDRALVLGRRTFGKGVVQSVLELPYQHRIRLTTGSWHTPLGRSLHRARDAEGRPLEEEDAERRILTTGHGRKLVDGGGIFPDVEIQDDTLTLEERELLQHAGEAQVPLALRLQEFGFEESRRFAEAGEQPRLREAAFEAFLEGLVEEGLEREFIEDPDIRGYLAWRARITVADRMQDVGSATRTRMERDPVLTEAVRLLEASADQAQLFAAAARARNGDARGETGDPDAGEARR